MGRPGDGEGSALKTDGPLIGEAWLVLAVRTWWGSGNFIVELWNRLIASGDTLLAKLSFMFWHPCNFGGQVQILLVHLQMILPKSKWGRMLHVQTQVCKI